MRQLSFHLTLLAALLTPTLVLAQVDCSQAGLNTPATTVPECVDADGFAVSCAAAGSVRLWPANGFQPASPIPIIRDSTDRFGGVTVPGRLTGHELFSSLDVVNVGGVGRRLHVAYNAGIQVWDIASDPANPLRLDSRDGWSGEFLSFPAVSEVLHYLEDIAAQNVDATTDVVAVAGSFPVGPTFWEFDGAAGDLGQLYQDTGTDAQQIRLIERNDGTLYAFAGASPGLAVYNVTAARALGSPCLDNQGTSCPTVFRGFVGNPSASRIFIDALHVAATDQVFVSAAGGAFTELELWELPDPEDPSSAVLRFSGFPNTLGSALFAYQGQFYLAIVSEEDGLDQEKLRIFSIDDCITTEACAPAEVTPAVSLQGFPTVRDYLSYSELDGRPYLYYGARTASLQGSDLEQLFDVSALPVAGPSEITQSGGSYADPCNGAAARYWSHYYHGNTHGLNELVPRVGKFSANGYFYRAAWSVLDVHVLGDGSGSGTPIITTAILDPQSEYWMGDAISFQASAFGDCTPTLPDWSWLTTPPADVQAQAIGPGTSLETYQFDCLTLGRCPNTPMTVLATNLSCPDALLTPAVVTVKDPDIEVTSADSGSSDTFETCEIVPLAATLAGRGPVWWEWHVNAQHVEECDANFQGSDLVSATVECNAAVSGFLAEIFADGFESGDITAWNAVSAKAGTAVEAELLVWDTADTSLAPRAMATVDITVDGPGVATLTGAPVESVDGPTVTLTAAASQTTTWRWEFEDPTGEDLCSFPGSGAVPCMVLVTETETVEHTWAAAGTYRYRVTVSNCGADTDSAEGEVTVAVGAAPEILTFALTENQMGCSGNVLTGFECDCGVTVEFSVEMAQDGSYTFALDWERASPGVEGSFVTQAPSGVDQPSLSWFFQHTFQTAGNVYPIVRAEQEGFSDEQDFITSSSFPLVINCP